MRQPLDIIDFVIGSARESKTLTLTVQPRIDTSDLRVTHANIRFGAETRIQLGDGNGSCGIVDNRQSKVGRQAEWEKQTATKMRSAPAFRKELV